MHTDIISFNHFSFYFPSTWVSQSTSRLPCRWKARASLTQGVRAALHRLVDLPRNSGHRLTHLPQHADSAVLLPAPRLVGCSRGGVCLRKTRGCEVPAHRQGPTPASTLPETQAAGSLQGGPHATHLSLRGPEPRPHPAWPSEWLICPLEGGSRPALPVSWEEQHVRPHQTQGQAPGRTQCAPACDSLNRRSRKEEAGHSQQQGKTAVPPSHSLGAGAHPQTPRTTLPAPCSPHPLLPGSSWYREVGTPR